MNLPNKLTVFRVILIPVFLSFYLLEQIPNNYLWALVVFAVAALTDTLDGIIARKYGLVTDFGKLMDPLADKLLVVSALVCILQGSAVSILCLILIISREFLVTSIRLLAAGKGTVIAADLWGKLKTIVQMVWICLVLLEKFFYLNQGHYYWWTILLEYVEMVLFVAMVGLTVLSGANYCWKNRRLFEDT